MQTDLEPVELLLTIGKQMKLKLLTASSHSGNIFWFSDQFRGYRGQDNKLPYDQHFLHGLITPRPLLFTEAKGDDAANPRAHTLPVKLLQSSTTCFNLPDQLAGLYVTGSMRIVLKISFRY